MNRPCRRRPKEGGPYGAPGLGPQPTGGLMEDMKRFVEGMILQTREDLEYQTQTDPEDPWMKFLEGKMHAFRLVREYLDKKQMQENLH